MNNNKFNKARDNLNDNRYISSTTCIKILENGNQTIIILEELKHRASKMERIYISLIKISIIMITLIIAIVMMLYDE